MRVIWITPGFPADESDHNCIPPLQLLAKELIHQGVDLQIIALEYPFLDEPYAWSPVSLSGPFGKASVFPCNGRNRRWLKWRTLWRAIKYCRDIAYVFPPPCPPPKGDRLRSRESCVAFFERPGAKPIPLWRGAGGRKTAATHNDVVIHSFWLGWASWAGEIIAKKHGMPHVTTLMGQDVLPANRLFLQGMNARRAERLVAVSDFQNQIFEQNTGFRAAHVIPWGVEEAATPAVGRRIIDVLGVGSLIPVKSWEKWLRTIAMIAASKPGIRVELIGDGPERKKLERLAWRLGLQGIVHFTGALPRPEVLNKMRQAKILLHTARFESFGFVLVEAAMHGCRVASTPVGIAPELSATAENESDMAALSLYLLEQTNDSQAYMSFTMTKTAEAYLQLYKNATLVL